MAKTSMTLEQVRDLFTARGYTLLSTEYKGRKQKLDFICPEGHEGYITLNSFLRGSGCRTCGRIKTRNKLKISYDKVKKAFEAEGYTLLSTEYTNNVQPLEFICPEGHKGVIDFAHFKRGQRCPTCGDRRLSYDDVKQAFTDRGYTLVSTTYTNNKEKLKYICPEGHSGSISYAQFKQGHGCMVCFRSRRRLPYEEVKHAFEEAGYTLLTKEYTSNQQPLEYVCSNGHRETTNYHKFSRGIRCPTCAGTKKLSYEEVKKVFEDSGYTLISTEYINSAGHLKYVCPKGHTGITNYNNFQQGKRCPSCAGNVSKAEIELRDYVISLVGSDGVKANTRSVIPPFELDIYVPSKKVAIEYCGLYWHSEVAGGKAPRYHRDKMEACAARGIRLLTIFEDEFLDKPDVVKSRVKNALGFIDERVFARKCVVKQIDAQTSASFLDKYHLQGSSRRSHGWGLFYGDRLLQVLTVGKVSRAHASKVNGKQVVMYELKRFATVPYVVVVGGAGKLFRAAAKFLRANGCQYIKSYSDNRYANALNSVYETLGFTLVGESKYTPHYVLGGSRYRNQSLRKTPEERLTGKTEWQLRREQGYDRIWDCGHKTYLFEL